MVGRPTLDRHLRVPRREAVGDLVSRWRPVTSVTTVFSTAGLHCLSAYDTGQMSPSSSVAASWKPRVEYRYLNFPASWKKTTTFPSAFA